MRFTKLAYTYQEQIDLLLSRGMRIDNHGRARRLLSHLNYYRLTAYWLPFEQDHSTHTFKPGTNFDHVVEYYIFDRELRLLVMDAIERVEVSLRSQWAYHLAHKYGPHAHLDATLFKPSNPKWQHSKYIEELKSSVASSSEKFIRHLKNKYEEDLPPIWAICEIMTFGQISRLYANLAYRSDRQAIASVYDIDESNLVSFIHNLSVVRNICAHHSCLWNREFSIAWKIPNYRPAVLLANLDKSDGRRLYNILVMIAYLMDIVNPGHHWKNRFNELLKNHSGVKPRDMGFPDNWRDLPIWRGTFK